VSRINDRVVREREELAVQAEQHLLRARTREIHATDFSGEQSIARKDMVADLE
jgi:hypothetical protein